MALEKREQSILLRATELIGRKGAWIKGQLFGGVDSENMDRYCALGAVRRATMEEYGLGTPTELLQHGVAYRAGEKVEQALRNVLVTLTGRLSIPSWNDSHGRTQAEVKALFCETVKKEVEVGEESSEGEAKGDPGAGT